MESGLIWRHKLIVWVLAAFLTVGAGIYGTAVGIHHALQETGQVQYEQALETNNFWRVIAGESEIQGLDATDSLALDLRTRIGEIDGGELPAEITDFVAPPNRYKGVTEALGFNPFADEGEACYECGALTDDMLSRLTLVKSGDVDVMIQEAQQPPGARWSLTSMPFLMELLVIWQLLGAAGMLTALYFLSDARMTWQIGDGQYDTQQILCIGGAPFFMLLFLTVYNRRKLRQVAAEHWDHMREKGYAEVAEELEGAIQELEERHEKIGHLPRDDRERLGAYHHMLDTLNQAGDEVDFPMEDRHLRRSEGPFDESRDALLESARRSIQIRRRNVEEIRAIGTGY